MKPLTASEVAFINRLHFILQENGIELQLIPIKHSDPEDTFVSLCPYDDFIIEYTEANSHLRLLDHQQGDSGIEYAYEGSILETEHDINEFTNCIKEAQRIRELI